MKCKWLKEGDKNTKFFHGMASARKRINRISSLMDDDRRLEKEEIIKHIEESFVDLYSKDEWKSPSLNNLEFTKIGEEKMHWLEREFEEEEVRGAIYAMAGDKAPGPDGYPMAFIQRFWSMLKDDTKILEYVKR